MTRYISSTILRLSILLLTYFTTSSSTYLPKSCDADCQEPAVNTIMENIMPHKRAYFETIMAEKNASTYVDFPPLTGAPCVDGLAARIFPCHDIDLVGFLPFSLMRGPGSKASVGNDIWGWTDPETGREYALSGQYDQTAIVEVTGGHMRVVAAMPRSRSSWSDIKVYENHMYVGTEGGKGIQIYDLTQIRKYADADAGIVSIEPDMVYVDGIRQSHNVVINEASGFLYVVGSKSTCRGGLHMVNITTPGSPEFAGCYKADGYTHDAQCVMYHGPHEAFVGHELCFNYNENSLTIVDVTDKENVVLISRTGYQGSQYTHQGWLTEDHQYLLLDDELDEQRNRKDKHTKTLLWNVTDLSKPVHFGDYFSTERAIDHNMYVKEQFVYQTNYEAGLRVLDLTNVALGNVTEVAYFDVRPEPTGKQVQFTGSWSAYIYFPSGNVVVNSIDRGLFLVRGTFDE